MSKHHHSNNSSSLESGSRSKKIYEKLKEWGLKDGLIGSEPSVLNPNVEFNLVFRFNIGPNERPIGIIFPKGKDFFVIESSAALSPEHKPIWIKSDPKKKDSFAKHLLKTAHWHNIQMMLDFREQDQRWGFSEAVFFDEFSKPTFMKHFGKIGNIMSYSLLIFQEIILENNGTPPSFMGISNMNASFYT